MPAEEYATPDDRAVADYGELVGNFRGTSHRVYSKEVRDLADEWLREARDGYYFIGIPNGQTERAMIYAIEAARQMASGYRGNSRAYAYLLMAVDAMAPHKDESD